jgi:galactoside O-acetyltransferase
MNSFYTNDELDKLGLKKYGSNVLISRNASIYSPSTISMGDNVRIDDFCILSGRIDLGSYIHISAFCALYGSYGIVLENYTGLSPRCTLFSASDDFSGNHLIGPMVDKQLTNVNGGEIRIMEYSQIGASSVLMPNVLIRRGVVVGAMSFVNKSLDEWGIYAGIPVKRLKDRSKKLLNLSGHV